MSALRLARLSAASAVTAGMLLGGTQLVVGQMAQARNTAMTSSVVLNVRSSPGLGAPVVGVLSRGARVTAIGSSVNGWTPVRFQGHKAWVYTSYLRTAREVTSSTATAATSGRAFTTEALNVRTGPGIDNRVLTVLAKGSRINLTGRRDGAWLQITLDGQSAWVNNAWISTTAGSSSTVAISGRARATADLMIRTTSNASFRSLGDIPRGTILQLTGKRTNGVAQILWQGRPRWVNSQYLAGVGSTSTTAGVRAPATIGVRYTTTSLSIRPASTGLRYLYNVPTGTALRVTGVVENGRAQVVVQGAVRWVTAMYLSGNNPAGSAPLARTLYSGGDLNTGGSVGLNSLTSSAKTVVGVVRANYPAISTMYGVRSDPLPDHPSGHAVDVMLPNYRSNADLGWQIARYMRAHASELNIKYVIYRQQIWSVARSNEGWRPMADRGGDTANHMDHVHITVN
ncbi:uncharacterized protein YgiM (DUF1202 family) [Luteococcus japonicus]|uniref:Uncharacterized protein YgiM (DUF1202 family) n=1 Tax=Luteococcus japonicus TaxID=33984 RepID=A0A3N1ZTG0_9ACTN|nr:SH3 domain-containing protein [Luteococcus japonicus]ROR54145.1 uncharacterized protein YgiM (DUF1202 family) [Luteococcus japonicus]